MTNRLPVIIILVISLCVSVQSYAAVSLVTTIPTSRSVALGRATSVSIIWRVTDLEPVGGPPGPFVVSSTTGTFCYVVTVACITLGTVSKTISKTHSTLGTITLSMPESVLVPSEVVFRAHKLGLSSFRYQRTFTPGGTGDTGWVTLNIGGSAATGFGVSRLALSFDNGAPVRLVSRNDPLQAFADVAFSGSGLLQAFWEVADPTSTSGSPIYRTLRSVNQYLIGNTQTLKGPQLPTNSTGLYLVRLRITNPAPGFDAPTIRYFVGQQGKPGPSESSLLPLAVIGPSHLEYLGDETRFSWQAVPGARKYQLEVYAVARDSVLRLPDLGATPSTPNRVNISKALSRPPVTGVIVSATQTMLSATMRRHLQPGFTYLWRVQAISKDGAVLRQSDLRVIRTP
ncbi:MAG: hypothetical protein V3S12_03230 [Acidiferrobacterales bacterium]